MISALVLLVAIIVGAGSTAVTYALLHHTDKVSSSAGLSTSTQTAPNPKPDGTVSAAAAAISRSVVTVNVSAGNQGGTGSGIVIKSDGYILTNNHVVTLDSQS